MYYKPQHIKADLPVQGASCPLYRTEEFCSNFARRFGLLHAQDQNEDLTVWCPKKNSLIFGPKSAFYIIQNVFNWVVNYLQRDSERFVFYLEKIIYFLSYKPLCVTGLRKYPAYNELLYIYFNLFLGDSVVYNKFSHTW